MIPIIPVASLMPDGTSSGYESYPVLLDLRRIVGPAWGARSCSELAHAHHDQSRCPVGAAPIHSKMRQATIPRILTTSSGLLAVAAVAAKLSAT